MNKAQLIDAISEKAGLTKADAKKALDAFVESTTDALKNGDRCIDRIWIIRSFYPQCQNR